jgi:hypothetical protein
MTSRFTKIARPLATQTTGETIGVGIAIFAGVIVSIIVGFVMASLFAVQAKARDVGQWEGSDVITRSWFKSLMQPDNPNMSCCGEADAYWADKVEVKDGKVFAIITDTRDDVPLGRAHVPPGTRIEVPPHKMKWDRGNPTGHVVIFLGPSLDVYCFVMNGGV